ncbi:MAG: hypothetical protein ACI8RZ_004678, partial [Myxococcota bacterium]
PLIIAAAAAAPPPNLDLDDVDPWEDAAFALTHGPAGKCWDFTGAISAELALYQPASVFSSGGSERLAGIGTFSGRLEDGVWTSFSYALANASGDLTMELPIMPLVGEIEPSIVTNRSIPPEDASEDGATGTGVQVGKTSDTPDESSTRSVSISLGDGDPGESVSMLRDSIDAWFDGAITTSFVRWDDERHGAQLVIEVPTGDSWKSPSLMATAFFPGGGKVATELDSVLPKRLTIGEWPLRAKIMDGQLHLRGQVVDGVLLPAQESWSALFGVAGFTAGYEQRLVYRTATECL